MAEDICGNCGQPLGNEQWWQHARTCPSFTARPEPAASEGEKAGLRFEFPVSYDLDNQIIWSADRQRLADIRGWGYLTGTGGFHLDLETAAKVQDARGIYITKAINTFESLQAALAAERTRREKANAVIKSVRLGLVEALKKRQACMDKGCAACEKPLWDAISNIDKYPREQPANGIKETNE